MHDPRNCRNPNFCDDCDYPAKTKTLPSPTPPPMHITDTITNSIQINKTFVIKLNKNTKISIYKYITNLNSDYDAGWDFCEPIDREKYDKLTDDQQIEFDDFILDISLFN